uniref:Uncharacterized protein n=1 Tax=Arundo donax TaxID=35708 RepID=A0A0A9FTI6_ARUDO
MLISLILKCHSCNSILCC